MNRKFQVFVSSTFTDLKAERQAAVEAILLAGHIPAGMELFSAGDETQLDIIRKWIDASDIYMLILGGRYGSIEPKSGLSYIEVEYDHATARGKPLFALVVDKKVIDERATVDESSIEKTAIERLSKFREKVLSKISRTIEDPKDVKIYTMDSLKKFEERSDLIGWVRANKRADASSREARTTLRSDGVEAPSDYMSAYQAVHYIADESQWGATRNAQVSEDGTRRNALIDAPSEFQSRAAEGKVKVFGASPETGRHELIPKTHWMSYGLDLSTVYKPDAAGRTTPATFEAGFHGARDGKHRYSDLKIEAADVRRVWPRRMDFDTAFDEAFEEASLTRDEAISALWKLRSVGVAIRNEPVPSADHFPAWRERYERWRKSVLAVAGKFDVGLQGRLEVLDQLRKAPNLPVVSQEHAKCITIASEMLLRLEERLP